jgi:hypothetical protein
MEVIEYNIGIVAMDSHGYASGESCDLTILECESLISIVPMYPITRSIPGDLMSLTVESHI